uniref:3-hydroxyisobutyrate dehydrogenase n=1 Tax=Lygus hesperus TaxID=30085 RepID=A0A0A9XX67_LYGHE
MLRTVCLFMKNRSGETTRFRETMLSSARAEKEIRKIGFIGLGNMGSRMSANLIKKGYQVKVNDLDSSSCAMLEKKGAEVVTDSKKLAGEVDCLITMLPASNHVLSLYNLDNGVIHNIRPGTLIIDCSTIDPSVAIQLAPVFKEVGTDFVDAPVSGGIIGAENGTLTFMVGGEDQGAKKAEPVLLSMGKNVIHCGPAGSGQIAKNCNNLLLAISMIGVAEAMNIGIKMGLDPSILAKVINISTGRCWSSDTYNPVPGVISGVPSSNGYKPGFTVNMITKDLNIAKRVTDKLGTPFEMGEKTLAIYDQLSKSEHGEKDFSVVYKYFKDKSLL